MGNTIDGAVAIVGVGAIMPDALNADTFWHNILNKRYSITEVPPERWPADLYYDPDPTAPDKTYTKIGGWVRGFEFDWRRFRTPPKVAEAMDEAQQWAVTVAAEALADYGYPDRPLDTEKTAVVLGTAMGGELHYITHTRIVFPEYAEALAEVTAFDQLPADLRQEIMARWRERINERLPAITEDTMPGELPNVVSGRVANLLNLRGPNFITDAACASSFAAIESAVELLTERKVDAVVSGGIDRNMGISSFVKFCKIGALSATGTRPFGEGADGFVMGEGAAAFLLKRLEDAERDGDTIYAVIRGVGGASDGKGKGITAPNPIGQQLALSRAWENAGLNPATATMIEAHGTSTRVGDVVEVEGLQKVFGCAPKKSIALGSVKSNIGHLKAGAGAAGLFKAVMALHHKILPPTLNAERQNPNFCLEESPFYLNHECREWTLHNGTPRRCGVSAYGFGGTNFHLVLEEHIPGLLDQEKKLFTTAERTAGEPRSQLTGQTTQSTVPPRPVRGILALGAANPAELNEKLAEMLHRVKNGFTPPIALPEVADIQSAERLVIDFGDHEELQARLERAQKATGLNTPSAWQALQAQGIFRGSGTTPGKMAFLFPGQGSQYPNMGRELAKLFPAAQAVFEEADAVMEPILGRPLTSYIFVDTDDKKAMSQAQFDLMQTEITQPAMLTLDMAMMALLEEFGFRPDIVMGHSLGEYAALIAARIMPFAHALEAAAARGSEMSKVSVEDNGKMAAILAPLEVVEETLAEIDGYVVPANINSYSQCVIGGASTAVEEAVKVFEAKGHRAILLPVSHAFHTTIVAPASEPLGRVLDRLSINPPRLPMVANVTGEFYPTGVEEIKGILQKQINSPVQWVKGLETLYENGVRTFVEVGPKRALRGFANEVFKNKTDVLALITNHPKTGALPTFNQALCGLFAAGYGGLVTAEADGTPAQPVSTMQAHEVQTEKIMKSQNGAATLPVNGPGQFAAAEIQQPAPATNGRWPDDRTDPPAGSVVISGTGLGLPGAEKAVMDPENAMRILRGEQFVDLIPERFRRRMVDKRVMRLVKSEDGSGRFETIDAPEDVIKLAGRPGSFDLAEEYGVPSKLVEALDITTQYAMAAGLDALREAGIPLVMTYKKTTTGKYLPLEWKLPQALQDETGVIFASAFPGGDRFADEFSRYYQDLNRREQLEMLEELRQYTADPATLSEITRRTAELRAALEREPYEFDRRFLFRILAMGHSQFAQYIGARGPNTQVNAACASTAQAIAIAEDWIRSGRCRRVVVIGADNVTGDNLMEWVGAGFLAVGAVTTQDRLDEAALPFDRRRHGTILGMGACALVLESEDAIRERGIRAIVELLSTETNNSAFHGTRLDVSHIAQIMDNLITTAERRFGLNRYAMAPQTVFVSHETYTPARGGSASAEVVALRETFGDAAQDIIVSNTKGFTGHPMGVGIEDVIAVKILEHGLVPPVPNFKVVDPDLGPLNLSRGGRYPVQYAIHLAAGFGSQISLTLTRRIPGSPNRIDNKPLYERWLSDVSGYDRPETEVVKRVLRIKEQGNPPRVPIASAWQYGTGPAVRTRADDASMPSYRPLPRPALATMPAPAATTPESKPAVKIKPVVPPPVTAEVVISPQPVKPKVEPDPAAPESAAPVVVEAVGSVTGRVLSLVAEQTGYPEDMLDLDLDLEADLGIDTVKQAETFAAIRQEFDFPRRDDLNLRDYNTLEKVIGFVKEMRPDLKANGQPAPTMQPVEAPPVVEPSAAAPPPVTAEGADPVAAKVLSLVAEQTGYPEDMLDLDLDLEADLGIDTVKQAETFAAIRQEFNFPRRDDLNLRDYNTLEKVIGFVKEMRPDFSNGRPGEKETAEDEEDEEPSPQPLTTYPLTDADQMPRRIPVPTLRPAEAWYKSTGVILDESSRVIVALDESGIGASLCGRLEKLGVTVLTLDTSLATEEMETQLAEILDNGPVQGVYWLPALDQEPPLEEMTLESWRELVRQRVKNLFLTMKTLYENVVGPDNFLVSATRLGGLHGYGPAPAESPLGGGVTGFTKAYKRERPQVLVKAVDFAASRKTAALADRLIWETQTDPGVVEVGYWQEERYTITLEEAPADYETPGLTLDEKSVFVITGAAGGITSAITADLAASAGGGTFYLLDLVEAPDPNEPQIALFRSDREALKQELIAQAKASGERPTPALIERQIMTVERQECALQAIEAVEAVGGTAHYRSLNLLDGPDIKRVIDEIREREGRIDVLIHAGGIEISRSLADKDYGQFSLVFDIKADGFFNLLNAAAGMPIGATVVFSSVAGRFGNAGQTDYSAANDLLCKLTSNLRKWRPDTRAIAIDWTAWAEIGMATRGSIPKIMEMAGIDLLPPTAGIPTVRRELVSGNLPGEVVVGGALGILTEEWDESGGQDVAQVNAWLAAHTPPYLMAGEVKALNVFGGVEVTTTLDPQQQPFLHDHAMDGTPLLPGVMGTETFAELAQAFAPGYRAAAVTNEQFHNPFKFYRREPQTMYLNVTIRPVAPGELVAATTLRSIRRLPKMDQPQEKLHFSAEVLLTAEPATPPTISFTPPAAEEMTIEADAIYKIFFHGPAFRVVERVQVNGDEAIGLLPTSLPPHTNPADVASLMAPRLMELCFQTAGVWDIHTNGTMGLPYKIRRVDAYRQPQEAEGRRLYALVKAIEGGGAYNATVVDEAGNVYLELTGYRTVKLPGQVSLK